MEASVANVWERTVAVKNNARNIASGMVQGALLWESH